MDASNFSNGFDTLLSSYAYSASMGSTDNPVTVEVDEYEKSWFLTAAQEEIVLDLYNGANGRGFEETEEVRRYLAPLIEESTLTPTTGIAGHALGVDSKHKFFTLPDDLWFITYEAVLVADGGCDGQSESILDVYPTRQDEYHKIKRNPFRGANMRRALRLDLSDGVVEIVSSYTNVTKYYVRYLRKPKPIIIGFLDDLNIEGYTYEGDKTPPYPYGAIGSWDNVIYGDDCCELPDSLHQRILERAVIMALQSKGQYNNKDSK